MKSRELRGLSDEKLQDLFDDKKQELFVLRQQKASGELKDTNALRRVRRDIARVLTTLRERQLAAGIAKKGE
jgi:large subunit ribosomal protein L29